jgi:hypothetical protein
MGFGTTSNNPNKGGDRILLGKLADELDDQSLRIFTVTFIQAVQQNCPDIGAVGLHRRKWF